MTSELFNTMAAMPGAENLQLPPRCFTEVNARIVEYVPGTEITIAVPLHERYTNPVGQILGGYLPQFFDLTFGPLSYLVTQKPTTSLDINTAFVSPVTPKDEEVVLVASVVNQSRSYLLLEGRATVGEGRLVATATSRMRILG